MKDKELTAILQMMYDLGKKHGYELGQQEQKDAERNQAFYKKGRVAEAAKAGDTKKALDLMGGVDCE